MTTTFGLVAAMGGRAAVRDGGGRSRRATRVPSCSPARHGLQWRSASASAALAAALALTVSPLGACHRREPAAAAPAGRETPSGLPVPRYVATKFQTVNARSGPGDDYPTVWTFHAPGLPLQVVAETEEWRRVCDPDGSVAWVHRRTVSETRRVMRTGAADLPLRARPTDTARVVAALAAHATAALGPCRDGWCRLTADKTSGWAPQAAVWGASDARQCP